MFMQHIDYMAIYTLKQYKELNSEKTIKQIDKDLKLSNLKAALDRGMITQEQYDEQLKIIESENE